MAFSKIVGFEVTPRRSSPPTFWPSVEVTPAGSEPIFCARSPESINARRMLSYQMLCPSFSTSINGFIIVSPSMLELLNHDVPDLDIQPQRTQRRAEKHLSRSFFAFLCVLCG